MTSGTDNVFRINLRRLIERQAPKQSDGRPSVRRWALERGVEPRNLYRIMDGVQSPTLALVDHLASACAVPPWALLTPNIDPDNPPATWITSAERETYLRMIDSRAFGQTTPAKR